MEKHHRKKITSIGGSDSRPCAGTTVTAADGSYLFPVVFFHDTDTIKLTVRALGYQDQEITSTSFTQPGLEVNLVLKHLP